jgi:hypothetical protein
MESSVVKPELFFLKRSASIVSSSTIPLEEEEEEEEDQPRPLVLREVGLDSRHAPFSYPDHYCFINIFLFRRIVKWKTTKSSALPLKYSSAFPSFSMLSHYLVRTTKALFCLLVLFLRS